MIDDAFVDAFLEDDKQAAAPGIENKATYTRAEVDDIVQKTIQSTMEALKGQINDTPDGQSEEEKEEETNGSNEESSSDSGETE
ncbi:MAG: hypothetical protein IIY21_21190 [Clostridiales bacterium]|nr:hypothetical protein [Clostridiales bacterium]MBQ1572937.1 hypothetical protein [Clostridiales bacterium]